jgi:signal transduction histidine kinase
MRWFILLLSFFCWYNCFSQVNSCDKDVYAYEASQLEFKDAKEQALIYQSYLDKNLPSLTADCKRRMYSLIANFIAVGGTTDSAAYFYRQAIFYGAQCKADTAIIFTYIDYARFFNVSNPDSFKRYITLTFEKLSSYTEKRNFKFSTFLKKNTNALPQQRFAGVEQDELQPALIADMDDGDKNLWRQYYDIVGSSMAYSPETATAEAYMKMALFFARNIPMDNNESTILNNLAIIYQNAGRHQNAAEYFLAAIEKNKKSNEEYANINIYGNVSYSYRAIKRFDVARQYALQGVETARKLKMDIQLCRALSQYASVFIDEGNYTDAEKQLTESIALSHAINNKTDLCYSMRKLANMLINYTPRLNEGKNYIDSSARYLTEIGDSSFLYFVDITRAAYYLKSGKYDEGLKYAERGYGQSVSFNDKEQQLDGLKLLYQIYEKKGNTAKALDYYKRFNVLNENTTGLVTYRALSDIQEKYETQKKQLAIDELEKDKLKKQLQTNILVIALAVMLLLVGLFFFFTRKLNRQKKELEYSNKQLADVTATQNRLFGIIGHDLRGMVAPFSKAGKVMSNYLKNNNLPDAEKFSLKLEEYASRLSETLNNLLHWSLQKMKGFNIQKEDIAVYKTVTHVVAHYEDVIKLKNIGIKINIPSTDILFTDKEAFQIIVRNLLSNAIKFTEGKTIEFAGTKADSNYVFSISDQGAGMTDEQVKRLFAFEDKKSLLGTRGEAGSGMGLVVVQKITEALGAVLKVQSTLHQGTIIAITFKT